MSDRLSNRHIDLYVRPEGGSAWIDGSYVISSGDNTALILLAREAQASRKVFADLRENHEALANGDCWRCKVPHPCPTIRLIDAAELSS